MYWLKEKISTKQYVGLFMGVFGVLAIEVLPIIQNNATNHNTALGNIFVFLAVLTTTLYILVSRRYHDEIRYELLTLGTLIASTVIFGLFSIIEVVILGQPNLYHSISTHPKLLIYVSVVGTALLFVTFQYGINKTSAFIAGISNYIQFPISVFSSVILLNESVSALYLVSSLLIVFGAILGTGILNSKEKLLHS